MNVKRLDYSISSISPLVKNLLENFFFFGIEFRWSFVNTEQTGHRVPNVNVTNRSIRKTYQLVRYNKVTNLISLEIY